jgi:single stranded DNA-binding protein
VDSINITVTGRLGADPRQGTTKAGKPWASFTVAADVPMRNGNGDREYETRWYQVWCHGPLAEHVAESLEKGDRVTVRADDVTCRTWTEDAPGRRARGQVELKAYDVSLSLRFGNAVAVRAPRAESAPAGTDSDGTDPWADGGQVAATTTEVPEVLAGVTR